MDVRKAKQEDAEKLLSMLVQLDNETSFMMYEPGERKTTVGDIARIIGDYHENSSLFIIAEEDSEIVGFLSAERGFANRIKHSAYIVVGVLQSYRGKGIGARLFREVENWAKESGIRRLELTVMTHNETAFKLYEKSGFKVEGIKEKSLCVNGNFVDEYYMARILE